MLYYKDIENGYITGIGTGSGQIRISEAEYNEIFQIIAHRPKDSEGYCYMLRDADLQWELVELPPMPEPEPTTDEVIDYLFGGDTE